MVLIPAVVKHSIDYSEEQKDYTSSLAYPHASFAKEIVQSRETSSPAGLSPEHLYRTSKPEDPATVIPLMKISLPILRGADPITIARLLREETDAVHRLRFVLKALQKVSSEDVLISDGLRAVAEQLDYEVARLRIEYDRILRAREHTLAGAALGIAGFVLAVSFPPSLAPIAAALGATSAGINSLKYVFAVRDTDAEMRRNDYYIAWRAWRERP